MVARIGGWKGGRTGGREGKWWDDGKGTSKLYFCTCSYLQENIELGRSQIMVMFMKSYH